MAVDLHTHSTVSDGDYSPEELVIMAKEAGLTAFAVSDHDSVEGARRAVIKGQEIGMPVITAAEISTSLLGKVIHVLIYNVDVTNQKLHDTLKQVADYRIARTKSIVENINLELQKEGKELLKVEDFIALGKEKPITRIDMAEELIRLGYVKDRNEAFQKWLIKYNVPNHDLSVKDVCVIAHEAGGVAVLAHPVAPSLSLGTITSNFNEQKKIIEQLKAEGLDGVECYHPTFMPYEQKQWLEFIHSLDMIVTGGSDFHGPHHRSGSQTVGANFVPDEVGAVLLEKRKAN